MTMIDTSFETNHAEPSVVQQHTSWGYRLSEAEQAGSRDHVARIIFAGLTFGMFAAGGMVWTLSDASFPGEPSLARAVLSTALYIIAVALVLNGAFTPHRDIVEVDRKRRVLKFISHNRRGWRKSRRTVRFEEITRIDLAETSLIGELKSALSRWDYGRITVTLEGKRPLHLIGGDMSELEPLLPQLRRDAEVY